MLNNRLEYISKFPLLGQWETDNGERLYAALSINRDNDLTFTLDAKTIELENNKNFLNTKMYTLNNKDDDSVSIGWFGDVEHGVGVNHKALYPDYAIAGYNFVEKGRYSFNTIDVYFTTSMWDVIDSKHKNGEIILKIEDSPKLEFETTKYKFSMGKVHSEKTMMSPLRYTLSGGALFVSVEKKDGSFTDVNEVLKVVIKLRNYFSMLNGSVVTIAGIEVRKSGSYESGQFIIPKLFSENIVEGYKQRGVGVSDFFKIASETFETYYNQYFDNAGLIEGYYDYIVKSEEFGELDTQISSLLQSIDMITQNFIEVQSAISTSETHLKKSEYNKAIKEFEEVLSTQSPSLKKFLKSAGKYYANPSLGDRLRQLAQDLSPIIRTRYTGGDYPILVGELRNDIMHGRGINYSKYNSAIIDYGSGLNALEGLVQGYLFRKFGLSEELLRTMTNWAGR